MPSRFTKAVAERIRSLREERKVSQEAFARGLGFDRAHYGRLERGEKSMSVLTAAKLARALGIGLDEMLAGLPPYDPADDDVTSG